MTLHTNTRLNQKQLIIVFDDKQYPPLCKVRHPSLIALLTLARCVVELGLQRIRFAANFLEPPQPPWLGRMKHMDVAASLAAVRVSLIFVSQKLKKIKS